MSHDDDAVDAVLAYHRRTKHHLHHYAASPGYLDWATQPDPFRTFVGAERVDLPLRADRHAVTYPALYRPGAVPPLPLERTSIAMLFELALGLSAWKEYRGTRWALRCNPSSGNLHPTEGYAILPEMPGLTAGVYHYVSRDHALERRCGLDGRAARQLTEALPPASFLVGLSSIHWREAWKYGERAFRYCQHDAGHAIAAVRYAAATLGWAARLIADVSDPTIAGVLGLTRPESFSAIAEADREHPDALLVVGLSSPPATEGEAAGVDMANAAGGAPGRDVVGSRQPPQPCPCPLASHRRSRRGDLAGGEHRGYTAAGRRGSCGPGRGLASSSRWFCTPRLPCG